jgi:hypothetical protein
MRFGHAFRLRLCHGLYLGLWRGVKVHQVNVVTVISPHHVGEHVIHFRLWLLFFLFLHFFWLLFEKVDFSQIFLGLGLVFVMVENDKAVNVLLKIQN